MKYLFIPIVLVIMFCSCSSSQTKVSTIQTKDSTASYDFDAKTIGFANPKDLGQSFFESLKTGQEGLSKYFVTQSVYLYVISISKSGNKEQAIDSIKTRWKQFEDIMSYSCKGTYASIKAINLNLNNAVIDTIEYKIDDMPGFDGKLKASPVIIHFTVDKNHYALSLGDCGSVKEKWFIMTPYIKWLGQQ